MSDFRQAMADQLADMGGYLVCEECGKRRGLHEQRIGEYMGSGWPKCCGLTMRWITRREIEAGTSRP